MEIELLQQVARIRVLRGLIERGETVPALELLRVIQNVTERLLESLEND